MKKYELRFLKIAGERKVYNISKSLREQLEFFQPDAKKNHKRDPARIRMLEVELRYSKRDCAYKDETLLDLSKRDREGFEEFCWRLLFPLEAGARL